MLGPLDLQSITSVIDDLCGLSVLVLWLRQPQSKAKKDCALADWQVQTDPYKPTSPCRWQMLELESELTIA